ncbi:MAG: HD-GYP domain-containing protein [Coprothermobacterota bacterium]|nr:HD-GYP domain-containing protein [Coprothermobacterota bacterium]
MKSVPPSKEMGQNFGVSEHAAAGCLVEEELRKSEARYRTLFEESPVALWEEDFSAVQAYLLGLPDPGPSGWKAFLQDHPEIVDEAIRRVRIVDVNQATLNFLKVTKKEEVIEGFSQTITEETRSALLLQLLAILEGKRRIEFDAPGMTVAGEPLISALQWVAIGSDPVDYSQVLVSTSDVTLARQAEELQVQSYRAVQKAVAGTIYAMARIVESRDPYTAGHQQGVARLAVAIGREMGLEHEQVNGLMMAALIHDLGKINVPSEILAKPTRLTPLEFSLIQTHSQSGYEILKEIEFPWPVARMVLEHHERFDGSGYPQGLSGEEILLEARILAVADVVEAMASHRPYRPALGIEAALEEIRAKRGTSFDPRVADACLTLFLEKGLTL